MRIKCPYCDRNTSLKNDGRIRRHLSTPGKHYLCTGSNRHPSSYTDTEPIEGLQQLRDLLSKHASSINPNEAAKQLVNSMHRTTQQRVMSFFLDMVIHLAVLNDLGTFDPRNEVACKTAGFIRDELVKQNIIINGRPCLPYI